jgi:hypothetical protein
LNFDGQALTYRVTINWQVYGQIDESKAVTFMPLTLVLAKRNQIES